MSVFEKISLFISVPLLILAIFFTGMTVVADRLPPYESFRKFKMYQTEVQQGFNLELLVALGQNPHIINSIEHGGHSLGRVDPDRVQPGYTLAEAYDGKHFGLDLLDVNGNKVHRWQVPQSVYDKIDTNIAPGLIEIMGAHLYPNGDALIILSRLGMVRLDLCSNPKWLVPDAVHHDLAVDNDGSIWTLSLNLIKSEHSALPRLTVPYYSDNIVHISADGEPIEEFSILESIFDSSYQALVLNGPQDHPVSINYDPTHTNSLNIVGEDFARHAQFAEPGDFLISLRTTDSLVLIDRKTHKVKWALQGPFMRQHDPDLLPDGTISVFDNRAGDSQFNEARRLTKPQIFGYSRIIRIDPLTQKIIWQYQGTEDEPFYTSVQGEHQYLDNGNVLITETEAGRVFEVDPRDNSIVWEWYNVLDPIAGPGTVGRVTRARRYPGEELTFLGKSCPQ
ncbi:MAG: arylsulfotransferase family protein [Alphaproteobacteria bacterium]|nr:arylsulfotransferase family protein [Alphaproteobacteria bacterium]